MKILPYLLLFLPFNFIFGEDFSATKIIQFQQNTVDKPFPTSQVTASDGMEKRAIILPGDSYPMIFMTFSENQATLNIGKNPVILKDENLDNFKRGNLVPCARGSLQLFNASEPDIDFILLGYDQRQLLNTVVYLKKK